MRVAHLTDFYGYDPAYSLCNVVDEQLRMLASNGYDHVLIVDEAFPKDGTPWHAYSLRRIPGVPRSNVVDTTGNWQADIDCLADGLRAALADVDVVISHDLIYQPTEVKHNAAARIVAAERPAMRWLHWIHSATPVRTFIPDTARTRHLLTPFPNAKIVFPNAYDIPRIARSYGVPETDVVCVPHSTDAIEFLMSHPLSRQLANGIEVYEADYVGCYPARLDRGKQVEFGIEVFAALKELGHQVRYVVFDFHSTGGDKVEYRKWLTQLSEQHGLEVGREVVFTSSFVDQTRAGCPREMVRDVMALSDVLILPSKSETYSLVAQEAALCRNLLVLNFDFPPMRSIFGEDALYAKFSSNIDASSGLDGETTTRYADRADYLRDLALRIVARLNESMAQRQFRFRRKYRHPQYVFRYFLEPLLRGNME